MAYRKYIALLFCLVFSNPLWAIRCGHNLVQVGDYKIDVLELCGDPDSVDSHYETRIVKNRLNYRQNYFNGNQTFPSASVDLGQSHGQFEEVLIEEWIYNFGRARLRKLLRFENGRLVEIVSLGKRR